MDPLDPASTVWRPPPPPPLAVGQPQLQPQPQPQPQPQAFPFQASIPAPPPAVDNNHTLAHPPYPEMIIAAITALKEREGSSRQAIAKYIQHVYPNLPSNHPTLLTYQLKKLKNEGHLAMLKHSYLLPGSVPIPVPMPEDAIPDPNPYPNLNVSPSSVSKRRPGRPPKAKTVGQPYNTGYGAVEQHNFGVGPVVGHPNAGVGPVVGQPNAGVGTEKMLVSLGLVDGPASPVAKRGRGRPPRVKNGPPEAGVAVVEKKGRGRPPRPKRGVGRPPKSGSIVAPVGPPSRRGRPRKVAVPGGRPRGRPPKTAVVVATGAPVEGGKFPVKRRGRPPRAGGAVKKPRRLSGKPMGRPRKNPLVTANQAAEAQHLVAYQDLKTKLEHFQSRVKQAVNVVKPHLNTDVSAFALGALQELEELANMDMTAPPLVPPQVQHPPPVVQS